ncbi:MAG: leishmanolysin-related zinc metalloendopeptidase [Gemmatimonas sp.]
MSNGVKSSLRLIACLLPAMVVAACGGGDDPQVATTISAPANTSLTGTVGSAVSTVPTVSIKDQKGKPLAGIWVRWTPSAGKVGNDSSQTDAGGSASAVSWTLGTTVGSQSLSATASGLGAVTFTADAKAGPVRVLTQQGTPATLPVGSTLPTPPSIRATDQYGNPVANVAITFAVATGAGTITGGSQTTNATGIATVGSWKLGTLSGTQTLRVDATESGSFTTVTAIASSGAATEMILVDPGAATGSAGKRLCTSPVIQIRDVYGNGVGQVPVVFVPAAGSGTVTGGGSAVSASGNGYATIAAWTLGTTAIQTLVATSTALPGKQMTFTTTLVAPSDYGICARFIGDGGTPRQREAITNAVAKWQRVIVGHVQTTRLTIPAGQCVDGIPAVDEDVEDLLLYVQLAAIDGPKNIIGQAAPCYTHLPSGLTLMGFLQLDVADLDLMLQEGTLDNVVLHEIGHILGIGTLWNYRRSLLVGGLAANGSGGLDPYFAGASARDQFVLLSSNYAGLPVPVENCVGIAGCGAGTRDSHWRKSVFNTELMQGYSNPAMPLSRVTVGSLADLGYTVNLAAADPFTLASAITAEGAALPVGRVMLNDVADTPMWGVEKNGTKYLLRAPLNPLKLKR